MHRRQFLADAGRLLGGALATGLLGRRANAATGSEADAMKLALCGDVMTGRGVDQILEHPSDPRIHEPWVRNARRYVELAEEVNGPIPRPAEPTYIWGEALTELALFDPDLRLINLETAITGSDDFWPGKGIHYRMHPANVSCLTAAAVDCCVLANNHVIDWGYAGLHETLDTLKRVRIAAVGAGETRLAAEEPAIFEASPGRRVLVFAVGTGSSGIPADWAATGQRAGVSRLDSLSPAAVSSLAGQISRYRRAGDVVLLSIHWGTNWGYEVSAEQRRFAHALIDEAGVDVVHGHSSHHPRGIEVHRRKPILYGCGDFLNDYEGIGGHEEYRPDLTLLYELDLEGRTSELGRLRLIPFRLRRFQLRRTSPHDTEWLQRRLDEVCRKLGTRVLRSREHLEVTAAA